MSNPRQLADLGTVSSGVKLGRQFVSSKLFKQLAALWCGAFASGTAPIEPIRDDEDVKALGHVLEHAQPGAPDLATLIAALTERPDAHCQFAALHLLRARSGTGETTLLTLTRDAGPYRRRALGIALARNATLSGRILGPVGLRRDWCDCGSRQHEVESDTLRDHVTALLVRRGTDDKAPLDPYDVGIILSVPPRDWLAISKRVEIARWMRLHNVVPPRLNDEAELLVSDPNLGLSAIAWLAGSGKHSEMVARAITEGVRAAASPNDLIKALVDIQGYMAGGIFNGRGWKRSDRPRVLVDLAIALLDRGVWPVRFERLFAHDFRQLEKESGSHTEPGWTAVQELLAEGLLAVAKDERRSSEQRLRAIRALGILRPGGGGSWLRALGAIREPVLEDACKQAVNDVRDYGPAVDAQLAVTDALEVFWHGGGADPAA